MKKIALLISVLGLAACGGGSNNGSGLSFAPYTTPDAVRRANSFMGMESIVSSADDAIARCQEAGLCSLETPYTRESAVLAGDNVPNGWKSSETATLYKKASKEFQNLLDILDGNKTPTNSELKRAWLLAGGTASAYSDMLANGDDVIKILRNQVGSEGFITYKEINVYAQETPRFVKIDDVNFVMLPTNYNLNEGFNFVVDKDGKITGLRYLGRYDVLQRKTGNVFGKETEVKTYSKGNLRFADFGTIDSNLFYGGYADKQKSAEELNSLRHWYTASELANRKKRDLTDLKFVGTAVGRVTNADDGYAIASTNATITVSGENRTWVADMPFATKGDNKGKFYDVRLDGSLDAERVDVNFTNGDKVDSSYQFANGTNFTVNNESAGVDVNIQAYGNGVITEIVGAVGYASDADHGAKSFQAVMGVAKK